MGQKGYTLRQCRDLLLTIKMLQISYRLECGKCACFIRIKRTFRAWQGGSTLPETDALERRSCVQMQNNAHVNVDDELLYSVLCVCDILLTHDARRHSASILCFMHAWCACSSSGRYTYRVYSQITLYTGGEFVQWCTIQAIGGLQISRTRIVVAAAGRKAAVLAAGLCLCKH